MAETYDEQQEREWHETAARITEKQFRSATEIAARVLGDDKGPAAAEVLSGLVQAMATNLSTVRRKR